MSPSDHASDQARAVLDALFADPRHNGQATDPAAIEQTREHGLDEPGHQGKPFDPASPGKWHKDAQGNWSNPEETE